MGHRRLPALLAVVSLAVAGLCAPGCRKQQAAPRKTVVIYTAHDRVLSEPILRRFERDTGVEVRAVYDTEASKTTGLVARLIARRDKPDCDVFWNNEIVQTIRLAKMGLLAPYASKQAERFPANCRDPRGRWTGFAARARLLIYNTDFLSSVRAPSGLWDFTDRKWHGAGAIARPFFGTTLTHAVLLHQAWGPKRLAFYCQALRRNGVALCTGNATVRDLVANGERSFGLTDTDDAYAAMLEGKPVAVAIPDADKFGAVLIPNTVALVAGCPHPAEGRRLIDFLLSAEVETQLAAGRGAQIPLAMDLADVKTPWDDLLKRSKVAEADFSAAADAVDEVVELLRREKMDR
jgi:iron(III) transport system substrate-binding protein